VQMIDELKRCMDIVLIDSPALLPVSDVITMAPRVDAIVMVTRTLWTPAKAAQKAKDQLSRMGCTIFGSILNGVSHSRGYYPYYYGYYGYYSYKYEYDYNVDAHRGLSIRGLGLRAEAMLRDGLQNARIYLPHLVALGLRFMSYCSRRPLFWLLLTALVGLTLVEAYLRPHADRKAIAGIELVTDSTAPASSGKKHPSTGSPAASLEELGTRSPGSGTAPETLDSAVVAKALTDSIENWAVAFNRGLTAQYLGYYDTLQFEFPGGTFADWRRVSADAVLSARQKSCILTIDSSRIEKVQSPYCRTSAYVSLVSAADTTSSRIDMIWHSHNAMWRIVRQKSQEIAHGTPQ
jgi:hypothetical protein